MTQQASHYFGAIDDVEKEIKRLQQLPKQREHTRFHYYCLRHGSEQEGRTPSCEIKNRETGESGILAVVETVIKAAQRRISTCDKHFLIPGDLLIMQEKGKLPMEICLLVDTSGSMSGKRLDEVKLLANQLVSQMHEPLSLVSFQESDVSVKVAATRNAKELEAGLCALHASGLTPLGDGIRKSMQYMVKRRGKKHLLILITDGLPTWAEGTKDPYLDAIEAGEMLRKHKIHMICIGLEPQRDFLEALTAKAGASLYIVNDLDHREIAAITRREKARTLQL